MLIELIVLIIVLALLLYVVRLLLPIDPQLYRILVAVACVIVVIWLLDAIGFAGGPHLRFLR